MNEKPIKARGLLVLIAEVADCCRVDRQSENAMSSRIAWAHQGAWKAVESQGSIKAAADALGLPAEQVHRRLVWEDLRGAEVPSRYFDEYLRSKSRK